MFARLPILCMLFYSELTYLLYEFVIPKLCFLYAKADSEQYFSWTQTGGCIYVLCVCEISSLKQIFAKQVMTSSTYLYVSCLVCYRKVGKQCCRHRLVVTMIHLVVKLNNPVARHDICAQLMGKIT